MYLSLLTWHQLFYLLILFGFKVNALEFLWNNSLDHFWWMKNWIFLVICRILSKFESLMRWKWFLEPRVPASDSNIFLCNCKVEHALTASESYRKIGRCSCLQLDFYISELVCSYFHQIKFARIICCFACFSY